MAGMIVPIKKSFWADPPGQDEFVKRKNKYRLVYYQNGEKCEKKFQSLNPDAAIALANWMIEKLENVELPVYLMQWVFFDAYIKMGFWIDVAYWEKEIL